PQTREAALVMIADMVVATARNVHGLAPEKIHELVDRAVQAIVSEGQLDECEITLRDLDQLGQRFARPREQLYTPRADAPPPIARGGCCRWRSPGTRWRRWCGPFSPWRARPGRFSWSAISTG